MGEKDLFHEPSVKVPLIVYDPSPAGRRRARQRLRRTRRGDRPRADLPRGAGRRSRTEQSHRLEGRSLVPFLHGEQPARLARIRLQRIRLFDAAGGGAARTSSRATRACSWSPTSAGSSARPRLPADAVSTCERSRTSCATSAPIPRCEENAHGSMTALNAWGLRLSQRTTLAEQQIVALARQVRCAAAS